nr:fucokinase [Blautia sp. NSJ-166]
MNVPKGSGLGTSSILSAACVKAVFEFMGISYTEEELYAHVLVMEQIMSTGGGWQDQVGGVTNGIKYITSKPGLDQQLRVEHIELQPETKKELNERFCLIYTGQRRLARNLLRDVVGRYVGNEPDSLYALNEIQKVAALMRFELERGKIDEFADLLNYHWELSRKVDAGSTNTLIDQIFLSIEDLIDAKMVCGAGGGGFLQVILKKGVQKADVHKRLKDVFQDNPVDVWDCEII